MNKKIIETPFLEMVLISDSECLRHADFIYSEESLEPYGEIPMQDDPILLEAAKQLQEYFSGSRTEFDIPLKVSGTDFQEKVWGVLAAIPYGTVLTYKDIAQRAGSSKAFRAAGGACKANRISVIIPCHRVLGSNGSSTGYSGSNTFMKENLLSLEEKYGYKGGKSHEN